MGCTSSIGIILWAEDMTSSASSYHSCSAGSGSHQHVTDSSLAAAAPTHPGWRKSGAWTWAHRQGSRKEGKTPTYTFKSFAVIIIIIFFFLRRFRKVGGTVIIGVYYLIILIRRLYLVRLFRRMCESLLVRGNNRRLKRRIFVKKINKKYQSLHSSFSRDSNFPWGVRE